MGTSERLIKNTFFLYMKMVVTMFVAFLTTRIVLNALGKSDFGVFNLVGGAIAMLGFLNVTMASTTQRFMNISEGENNPEKQKTVFNVGLVIHFGLALFMGLVLFGLGFYFFNGGLNIPHERGEAAFIVYACMIVSTMFTIMSVPYDAMLNAHENMKYYAIVGIIESLLRLGVALLVSRTSGDRLIVYGIFMALIPLCSLSFMRIYCHKHYDECVFQPHRYWSRPMLREELSFASWNLLTAMSMGGTMYGMGLVANHFWGVIVNAAQGIATQVGGAVMHFSESAMKALNPIIIKSEGAGNRQRLLYTTMLGCRVSFTIFAFFSIPIVVEMPLILQLWLKNVPEWTIVFCRLQLALYCCLQLVNSIATTIYAEGHIRNYAIGKSITNLLPLAVAALLFWKGFSPTYIYILEIIGWFIFGGAIILYYAHQQVGFSIRTYLRSVLAPIGSLLAVVVPSLYALYHVVQPVIDEIWGKLIILIVYAALYIVLAYFIVMTKNEKQTLMEAFRKHVLKSKK